MHGSVFGRPQGKRYVYRTPRLCFAGRDVSAFRYRMTLIANDNSRFLHQYVFDLGERNAMLLAFRKIAPIPFHFGYGYNHAA
jgi:hypothetical protein